MIKYFDGGLGTMLNLRAGELPEKLNITDPQRVFAVGIDSLSPPNDNYGFILSSFQKYQLDCQIALDKLISFLSSEDYLRIEDLFKKIRQTSDICFEICGEERKIYQKIEDLKSRDSMLQMFELEKSAPNSFSKEDLEYGMKVLRDTSHVQSDDLWEKIEELLTYKQCEVVYLRNQGYSNREIADLCGISRKAVEKRFARIRKILNDYKEF